MTGATRESTPVLHHCGPRAAIYLFLHSSDSFATFISSKMDPPVKPEDDEKQEFRSQETGVRMKMKIFSTF